MTPKPDVRDQDTSTTELQNTTATGRAPRTRLATPEAAFAIYDKFVQADEPDAMRRATIQGMIDGNPPYNPKELEELGLADMVNVNFLTMRANLDARAAAAHELFMEVPTLIECRPLHTDAQNAAEQYHNCSIVAEEFSQLLLDWPQFHPNMDMVVRESDAFGIGFMLWQDQYDWRPHAYKRGTLRFDPKALVEVDRNDVYTINGEYTAGELYDIIEDEQVAVQRGWKPGNVRDLLVRTFIVGNQNDDDPFKRSPWESLQQMARNNDPQFQEKQFEKVRVVHLLVREVAAPRRVSHYIIPENSEQEVFLCEVPNQYADMHEAIWWLPYNYGDGYARSVRGVASFMVQHDDLSNRFLGRVFDAGFMASSLLLQPVTQGDLGRLQFTQHGPYTILPPELKAVQSTFQPQLQPLLALRQVSENVLKNNTGLYRQHNESVERETQKTARQVVEEVSKEARYEKAAVAHRYVHLDLLYREILRRLTNKDYVKGEAPYPGKEDAKRFIDRCKARGVPESWLFNWKDHMRVDSTRALGLGSLGVKYDITNQLMAARGDMDEFGRRAVLRDWLAARVGYRNTDKYAAAIDRDRIPTDEQSLATLENNDIFEGAPVVVGVDQLHKLHLDVHLQPVVQLVQAEEAGQIQDPEKAALVLQTVIPHIAEHLQLLAREPTRKQFVDQVSQVLQMATRTLGNLTNAVKRIQQQRAQAQQEQADTVAKAEQVVRDREFEARIYEINRKYELERMKQESLNAARAEKTGEQMSIRRAQAENDARLRAEEQAEILRQKALTAEAEREIKRRKAGQ